MIDLLYLQINKVELNFRKYTTVFDAKKYWRALWNL